MNKGFDCPVCEKEVYSGIGNGCKMCGMLLTEREDFFCCGNCEEKHQEINN